MCGKCSYICGWVHTKSWRLEWEIEFENAICYTEDAVKFSKRTEIDSIRQTNFKVPRIPMCNHPLPFNVSRRKIYINIRIVIFNWVQHDSFLHTATILNSAKNVAVSVPRLQDLRRQWNNVICSADKLSLPPNCGRVIHFLRQRKASFVWLHFSFPQHDFSIDTKKWGEMRWRAREQKKRKRRIAVSRDEHDLYLLIKYLWIKSFGGLFKKNSFTECWCS